MVELNGIQYVAVKNLDVGDIVRLIGDEPNEITDINRLEYGRVILTTKSVTEEHDVWCTWLWGHSMLETIEWKSKPSGPKNGRVSEDSQ